MEGLSQAAATGRTPNVDEPDAHFLVTGAPREMGRACKLHPERPRSIVLVLRGIKPETFEKKCQYFVLNHVFCSCLAAQKLLNRREVIGVFYLLKKQQQQKFFHHYL